MEPIRTRKAQGTTLIEAQRIHDTKYATKLLASGVLPSITEFFRSAPLGDYTYDNYASGGNLVDSGKEFVIYQIAAQLIDGTSNTLLDWNALISKLVMKITTAQKEYGYFPLLFLPQGGGLNASGGQVSVSPSATPGVLNSTTVGAGNGIPQHSSMFKLAAPLVIQANQSFKIDVIAPNGVGFTAITLTGSSYLRIILDGIEQRAAA
jgi:hypothetical protein